MVGDGSDQVWGLFPGESKAKNRDQIRHKATILKVFLISYKVAMVGDGSDQVWGSLSR